MYKHGQTLWVHPHLPVKPGDGVLIVKQSDEALNQGVGAADGGRCDAAPVRPREEGVAAAAPVSARSRAPTTGRWRDLVAPRLNSSSRGR